MIYESVTLIDPKLIVSDLTLSQSPDNSIVFQSAKFNRRITKIFKMGFECGVGASHTSLSLAVVLIVAEQRESAITISGSIVKSTTAIAFQLGDGRRLRHQLRNVVCCLSAFPLFPRTFVHTHRQPLYLCITLVLPHQTHQLS